MRDPYNWYDPAHPERGHYAIETPTTRAEVFDLISHLKKPEDRFRESPKGEVRRILLLRR